MDDIVNKMMEEKQGSRSVEGMYEVSDSTAHPYLMLDGPNKISSKLQQFRN